MLLTEESVAQNSVLSLLDTDYQAFSYERARVTALSGDYVQFIALYESGKVVLWDKNLKLPMHEFHYAGEQRVKDIVVTEDTIDVITEFYLLLEERVVKVNLQL